MEGFTIAIAGAAIEVHSLFGSTREYFRNYITPLPAQTAVAVTQELLVREQRLLNEEADREGLKRRVFTDPFLERTVIQRQTAGALLQHGTLFLHGSTVAVDGQAYLFTAKTGVGKSTHTRLWREVFGERAVMVNDDRAFLRTDSAEVIACGSPWSGKHGLDCNIQVPLAGICILERGTENRIAPITPEEALPLLLEQAYLPKDGDEDTVRALTKQIAARVPLWQMQCTRDPEAAQTAHDAMENGASK